ncbi:MAG: hypothetical protein HY900_11760 [Deltaproteobacteria bacterium]|nr:hypothetical protein [Deltaproteobacteria bacterium]
MSWSLIRTILATSCLTVPLSALALPAHGDGPFLRPVVTEPKTSAEETGRFPENGRIERDVRGIAGERPVTEEEDRF